MIKLWATTPSLSMDEMTPRDGVDRNPFDMPSSASSSYNHHPLLTPTRLSNANANPFDSSATSGNTQPSTATHTSFAAALPTTSVSLHAPDFNMHAAPRSKPHTPSPPPPLTASRGQIHVKLIQARALNVHSSGARPYVVVQFEQNEFISRDPTDDADKEVKGVAAPQRALNALARASGQSPSSSKSPSLFGSLSAHNPTWKHEVSLCVANVLISIFFLPFRQ